MISEFLRSHGEYYDDKYFSQLTTYKAGGKIAHFCIPNSVDDLKVIIDFLKSRKIDYKIIGNGSNLICGQSDYNGVVIKLSKLTNYELTNNELYMEAGVMAPAIASYLSLQGLSGMEFASGIPGSIGGLVYMNAGAYKKSMSDIISSVLVLKDGDLIWFNNEECNFAYRHSIFGNHPHWIIVACKVMLQKKNPEEIQKLMADRLTRRKNSQPLDMPSAGSTFRNPENGFAWELIDGIGYRGKTVGGATVSIKHSNFIVNAGSGTGEDYLNIAYDIQDKVKTKYGIKLVLEVEKFNC